jgi:GGDEF domain-containing protein
MGVASFPEDGAANEVILAAVDGALYQAKRQGRNQVLMAG